MFTLVVDDFAIKYTSNQDADHLISALQDLYEITIDWSGKHFIGIHLDWDYEKRTCDLSMPNYVHKGIDRYMHKHTKQQHTPSKHIV